MQLFSAEVTISLKKSSENMKKPDSKVAHNRPTDKRTDV